MQSGQVGVWWDLPDGIEGNVDFLTVLSYCAFWLRCWLSCIFRRLRDTHEATRAAQSPKEAGYSPRVHTSNFSWQDLSRRFHLAVGGLRIAALSD